MTCRTQAVSEVEPGSGEGDAGLPRADKGEKRIGDAELEPLTQSEDCGYNVKTQLWCDREVERGMRACLRRARERGEDDTQ